MAHLRSCEECRELFAARVEWSSELKASLETEPAPDRLRQRVFQLVGPARDHFLRRWFSTRLAQIVAAGVVAVVVGAVWMGYRSTSAQFFQLICEDHAKYLDAQAQVESSDPAQIESWFRDKADFGVRVPALRAVDLVGARLCFLKQRKAALLFYRKHGRPVSLFQFSAQGVGLRGLERAVIDGAPLWRMSYRGFTLAAFEHRGVISVLVSDLRESELLQLASAARAQSAGY